MAKVNEKAILELSDVVEGIAPYMVRDLSSTEEKGLYRLSGSSSQSCSSQNTAGSTKTRAYEAPIYRV